MATSSQQIVTDVMPVTWRAQSSETVAMDKLQYVHSLFHKAHYSVAYTMILYT